MNIQPKGKARKWNEDERKALAILLLLDFEDARQQWRRYVPPAYAALLDAVAFADRDSVVGSPAFWFDLERQQYAIGRRGYIAPETIRKALETIRRRSEQDTTTLAAQVAAGLITIDQFQNAMVDVLKPLAIAAAALGRGGLDQLDDADKTAVSAKVDYQLGRLSLFAFLIKQEDAKIATPEKIINRARNYPNDALTQYDAALSRGHIAAGFIEELSVLGVAEHCRPEDPPHDLPDCVTLATIGWQPINTIPLPGQRKCLWNCRCNMQYRRAAAVKRNAA